MNRRGFLAALAALPFAGRALEALALLEKERLRDEAIIRQLKYQGEMAIARMTRDMHRQIQGTYGYQAPEWDLIEHIPPEDLYMHDTR